MASRSKTETRKKAPAGKKRRAKKVLRKRTRVPRKPKSAKVLPAGPPAPPASPDEWKPLLEVAVAIEALCDEVERAYTKWSKKPLSTKSEREECREVVRRLSRITSDTLDNYNKLRKSLGSMPGTSASATAVKAAFNEYEDLCLGSLLERLGKLLDRIARLLAVPYSSRIQDKIDVDLKDIRRSCLALSDIATRAHSRIHQESSTRKLPWSVKTVCDEMCSSLRTVILDTTPGEATDKTIAKQFEERLPIYIAICESVASKLVLLRQKAERFLADSVRLALGNKQPLEDVAFVLEKAESLRRLADHALEFMELVCDRAVSIDPGLEARAAELRDALKKAEAENGQLRDVIDRGRGLLACAPFRNRMRRRPLPAWSDLSAKQQQVVAALVRLRDGHSDGPYFVVSRVEIATAMGLAKGTQPPFKILENLEEDYEIIGMHQQARSSALQQATNWYWLAEDAFGKYLPHVEVRSTPPNGRSS